MIIWRAEKAIFAKEVREGIGARRLGGRWTSPGRAVIYCAGSSSTAMLEILAHIETEEDAGVKRLMFQIEIDDKDVEEILLSMMPKGWRSALNLDPCRARGDAWLRRGSSVALKVPSAINPNESNFLLNPAHPDFKRLKWSKGKPFQIDARLLKDITPTP